MNDRPTACDLLHAGAVALGLAMVAAPLAAQAAEETATLSGIVIDAASGTPVPDATVALPAHSLEVRTDADGAFELHDVPVGTWIVSASRFGYLGLIRRISIDASGRHVQLGLDAAPFALEGLTVAVDGVGALTGRVVDAGSGRPLPGVVVWVPAEGRGVPADDLGRFVVPEIPYGPQVLQVSRAGYGARLVPVTLGPRWTPVEIALQPDTAVLSRLPALSDRLRGRRNLYQGVVTTHDVERLVVSGVPDVREYIQKYTLTSVVPCSGVAKSFWCIEAGGNAIEPQVCVDGWLEWGGLDVLQQMGPHDLHLLEVYGTRGRIIRAYTHAYMETLARGVDGVTTDEPAPQREGVEGLGWSTPRSGAQAPLGLRC